MPLTESIDQVFRDFATPGIPSSGEYKPEKSRIRTWGNQVEDAINAFLAGGGLIYASKTAIDADLSKAANTQAWVIEDSTPANNGIYRKIGVASSGSWTRVADLPYSFIFLSDVGAGTAAAIQVTSSIPLPTTAYKAMFTFSPFEDNTTPTTLAVNGGTAKPIVINSGSAVGAGYLKAGMAVVLVDDGTNYRLLSDVASASIQSSAAASAAAALAAQVAAEAARDAAVAIVGSPNAAAVAFTPAGNIAATNVQAALQELDTEKLATGSVGSTVQGYSAYLADIVAVGDPNADRLYFWDDSAGHIVALSMAPNLVIVGTELRAIETHAITLSDETTTITTGAAKASFCLPYQFTLVGVFASLNTVSSSGTPTVDINEAGVSIMTTNKIVIDASEFTGGSAGYQGTAATAAVITDAVLAAFAQITFDIDVAGTGAKGLKVWLIGYRSA